MGTVVRRRRRRLRRQQQPDDRRQLQSFPIGCCDIDGLSIGPTFQRRYVVLSSFFSITNYYMYYTYITLTLLHTITNIIHKLIEYIRLEVEEPS